MLPSLQHRNGTFFIDNTPLQEGALAESYLTAEGTSGNGTITLKNIVGFAVNQILLIEDLGGENAEIILTHGSTVPSGTTVTLASNLVKTHPVGSKVRVIAFDRFELSQASTAAGSKTVLTVTPSSTFNPPSGLGTGLVAVDATLRVQAHWSDEHTSGFYFARYKNSITSDFSGYSDALAFGGWDESTVGYMIEYGLKELGLTLSEKITRTGCYQWINECLREIAGKLIRWPEHYNFNYALTALTAGDYQYALPADIYDNESNRSILAVRIGASGTPLTYLDPIEFEEKQNRLVETTAAEAGDVGETALDLTNAADFATSGTVYYYVSGTQYSFTYTGKSSNTLTGIPASGTGSITQAITSGDAMYQSATFGAPTHFTVREGSLDLSCIPGAQQHGKTIYLDYAMVVTSVDSDGDTIDLQRYDMVQNCLTWRMDMKARNTGKLDMQDGHYLKYKEKLNDAIRTSPPSQIRQRPQPRINTMRKR